MGKRWLLSLLGVVVLCSAMLAGAETRVPVQGLYPDKDGQALHIVVPDGWQLIDSQTPPNKDGANGGHVRHSVAYIYADPQGQQHQVKIEWCGGGE